MTKYDPRFSDVLFGYPFRKFACTEVWWKVSMTHAVCFGDGEGGSATMATERNHDVCAVPFDAGCKVVPMSVKVHMDMRDLDDRVVPFSSTDHGAFFVLYYERKATDRMLCVRDNNHNPVAAFCILSSGKIGTICPSKENLVRLLTKEEAAKILVEGFRDE